MAIQFLEQENSELTEATCQAMLGFDLQLGPLPVAIDLVEENFTGKVEISGAWNGVMLLRGSGKFAHSAASAIFSNGPFEVTAQDRQDAMYELSHVMANNVKALLPRHCQLSLPQVMKTTTVELEVAHAECVSELVFDCQDQPLSVSLWKR